MRRREAGKEAPKGDSGLPPDAWSGNPPPRPRPHRTPADGGPRAPPPTHVHTLRTRLRAWMTSHVNVTHAGDSRSAEGPVCSFLPLLGLQWLGSSSLLPHSVYGNESCARKQSALWSRPLGKEGGANLSGTRWLRPPGPGPRRLSAEVSLVQVELILVSFRQYEIKSQTEETSR